MIIEVKKSVNVSLTPYCGSCEKLEPDMDGRTFCILHATYLPIHNNRFLKCRECYMALYDTLVQGVDEDALHL